MTFELRQALREAVDKNVRSQINWEAEPRCRLRARGSPLAATAAPFDDATKNGKPRRVPLRPKVVEALKAQPARLDSKLLFPNRRGGYIDLHNWREREWNPALEAAGFSDDEGKADRGPYALRHTFATWALRAGLPTFTLARRMGTSLEMIDRTYGHHAPDAEEWELERLTAFDSSQDGRSVDAGETRS